MCIRDSDYGVVGCTYDTADWQYIALDVQADYMREGTVCHEIWHATENEILLSLIHISPRSGLSGTGAGR